MSLPPRIGFGFDVHRFAPGRELWLGGVRIPYTLGLLGHSDADVALHAICDALLGAAALRDIGYWFPDSDPRFEGIDSKSLLCYVNELLSGHGYRVGNVDVTICLERPKLRDYIPKMQTAIAECLAVPDSSVSIKATTTERLGFTGREEGIAAYAVAMILDEEE